MQNKKIIILTILGIAAVISLFYGMFAPSKTKRNIILKQTNAPHRLTTRNAGKTAYSSWSRNPFLVPSESQESVLSGIMDDKENQTAIINNNIVKIGDKVNGNTVVDIKQDKVILNDGVKDFELKLGQ